MADNTARETDHKEELVRAAQGRFPNVAAVDSYGQSVLHVARSDWKAFAAWLRDEQGFTQCSDITAVDQLLRPARPLPARVQAERFEVVANFLSHPRNLR